MGVQCSRLVEVSSPTVAPAAGGMCHSKALIASLPFHSCKRIVRPLSAPAPCG